jgi:quinoprotein relay system zinc metallohydrolase 2
MAELPDLRRLKLSSFVAAVCLVVGPVRADSLSVREIAPGVYLHRGAHEDATPANLGGIANIGFVVGEQAVAVIDSGGSARQGAALLAAVRAVTDLPVRYVINTHMHPDHVFGNVAFRDEDAIFVGHAKLPRALAARGAYYLKRLPEFLGEAGAGTEVVPPSLTVTDQLEVDLGNRPLLLTAHPTAHTDNDLTVLDLATGTLWLGDLLFSERTPVIDGSLKGWLAVHDQLSGLAAERVVPGHGPVETAWPDALAPQRRYLEQLLTELRRSIAEYGTMTEALETVAQDQRGSWLLFDDYHPRNVVTAFKELEWE